MLEFNAMFLKTVCRIHPDKYELSGKHGTFFLLWLSYAVVKII